LSGEAAGAFVDFGGGVVAFGGGVALLD